jgi:hypothetical protein
MAVLPSRHVEYDIVAGKRLGRRLHDPDRPALHLGRLLSGAVPPHPASIDHFSKISNWGVLGNDHYSDCGPAMVCHDRMLVKKYLAGVDLSPDTADATDLYKRSGNPNFPQDDNGVVLADMLSEVQHVGVGPLGARVKCIAYAQVDVRDLDEIRAAIAIFGSLHLGVDLQRAQQRQTDMGGPWDVAPNSAEWGGHAVLAGFYTSDTTAGRPDISVVTWGKPIGVTDTFWTQRTREAWVVIWPEHLGAASFIAGIDQAALASDYTALTGRPLPVPPVAPPVVPPSPSPVPTPPSPAPTSPGDLADRALAEFAKPWAAKTHVGQNAKMAKAIDAWILAKHL